jgi:hypothetical protein
LQKSYQLLRLSLAGIIGYDRIPSVLAVGGAQQGVVTQPQYGLCHGRRVFGRNDEARIGLIENLTSFTLGAQNNWPLASHSIEHLAWQGA